MLEYSSVTSSQLEMLYELYEGAMGVKLLISPVFTKLSGSQTVLFVQEINIDPPLWGIPL